MASNESKACVICINDFDTTDRQTVALPCGHNFCLTCLVCLKASDCPVCPQCCQNFAEVKLPDSSSFVSILNAENRENVEETNEVVGSIDRFVGCEVHYEQFVFWSKNNKEFYCIKCIVTLDLKKCDLELVANAVPLIRKDFQTQARAVSGNFTSDLTENTREREEAVQERKKIKQFAKELLKLNTDLNGFIREVDCHNFMRRKELDSATKIEEQIGKIKSADDMAIILECKKTLEGLQISSQVPLKTRPVTFLSDVACTYEEEGGQKVSFIKKLQKRKNTPAKPEHRADGNPSKMDIFILRCIEIRRMLFMSLFNRPHRDAIQQ